MIKGQTGKHWWPNFSYMMIIYLFYIFQHSFEMKMTTDISITHDCDGWDCDFSLLEKL